MHATACQYPVRASCQVSVSGPTRQRGPKKWLGVPGYKTPRPHYPATSGEIVDVHNSLLQGWRGSVHDSGTRGTRRAGMRRLRSDGETVKFQGSLDLYQLAGY
jgi:hypothetical protein